MIVGRVLAGVGGCGLYVGNLNLFSALTQVVERAQYFGYVGAAWCLGTIGAIFKKISFYMAWFTTGGSLCIIGASLLAKSTAQKADSYIYGCSVILGLGSGLFAQLPYAIAQARQPPAKHPKVTAFISCGQMAGIALSIDVGTIIFVNRAESKIAALLPRLPYATIQGFVAGAASNFFETPSPKDRDSVLSAVITSIDDVFIMIAAASGVAVLVS
ncbi:MAG: hypothetical protein Q9227_004623 [Pyrenula ochraceoflavens]